ncbi:alanine dehydrogenase [Lewinella marina]|uniref:Saccharopine dehydrogenase [NAD(+), L-lysine-forming] n=1 Tax=Neolewinella marina TaxID=438751 RepID=A0A2G0CFK2_9BACT|nr:NAD(P)-dependent oxidoreductase [Neolewinella marina]NJB85560.1 alanine dehydrogenase [Neolewinella marina]PHK98754.1 alanine dehydrogenase [Neolewinella marina]
MPPNQTTLPSLAVVREDKSPPDARVPLTPRQAAALISRGWDVVVQTSPHRCFPDEEYARLGVPVREDITTQDILLGIKEVPISRLVPGKTYCNFAHVAKFQPYNQGLLRALLDKGIRHIDYEYLTDDRGRRLIAFGYWAGMVGAHNAVWAFGKRTGSIDLPRLKDLHDYAAVKPVYAALSLPPVKVVLTGTGRVGAGAARVLRDMGFRKVSPAEFLEPATEPVFTQLAVEDYVEHPSGKAVKRSHFYAHSAEYRSRFGPYCATADIFINGIFWDGRAPAFFSAADMEAADFRIQTIADVTCDIAPAASVPSTLRATTIADPVFGYQPRTSQEASPYTSDVVDVMSVDNLPSELPRDASQAFGETFMDKILPEFTRPESDILLRATITRDGELGPHFTYLKDFAAGVHPA